MINAYNLFHDFVGLLYKWVWAFPLLLLIVGVGVYLTVALRGLQFRYLFYGLRLTVSKKYAGEGEISHYESLMTALAATVGISNIAGVSTALTVGGFGAIFWMWVTALLGMAIKYSEAFLAITYREEDARGETVGGPMFYISKGLGWKTLALSFAIFGAISSFGGGNMLQANSIADALRDLMGFPSIYTGILLAVITGMTLIGGIKSIGRAAGLLVPFMAIFYLSGAFVILWHHLHHIPGVFGRIFADAFTGQAAVGGFAGATLVVLLQTGVSRGLMTSESGLGTGSIAAAAAKTDYPGRQAMVSMTGSFLATIVMCTVSALVIGVTGVFGTQTDSGSLVTGVSLTILAFNTVIPWGSAVVTGAVVFFGFTTLLGWAYYGEKCVEYFLGAGSVPYFRAVFSLVIIPGAVLDLKIVWMIADAFNGLMAIPNLIGVIFLSPLVVRETKEFLKLVAQEQRDEAAQK